MEKLILARWDVIHRAIRDVRLSLLHGANGEFFQAQFHSQYLFSLQYRPFGSSGFHEDKKRLLELMLSKERFDDFPLFADCWERIRDELAMDPGTTMEQVWQQLPLLDGFRNKQSMPKLSRWFSWNQAAEEKLPEWTALKMVLAYHFDGLDLDPDEAYARRQLDQLAKESDEQTNMRKEFGKLKEKLGGGLKLCYHIMSQKLWVMIRIIVLCTRPVWSWYSHQVKDIQNPVDQVGRLVQLKDDWAHERHLRKLAALPTSMSEELISLVAKSEFADTAAKISELSQRLLKHRAWSLSRASAPPDCYAGLLCPDPALQQAGAIAVACHCH